MENEISSAHPGTVEGGRWVILSGLHSETGKRINGKCGQVVGDLTSDGRYPVLVDGKDEKIGIKPNNLDSVTDEDLVQVVRLACAKERRTMAPWKVLLFPRQHSMFSRHGSRRGNSEVMALCGVPIVVEKTKPQIKLYNRADFDCQWATYFMIEHKSGFAPMEWQSNVGPVMVYRPGGLHFGNDDVDLLVEWFSTLLENYSEENFDHKQWLTPVRFQRYKASMIENRRRGGWGSPLRHLHI